MALPPQCNIPSADLTEVDVIYHAVIPLTPNTVELDGRPFFCGDSSCAHDIFRCCNGLGCLKCSCMSRCPLGDCCSHKDNSNTPGCNDIRCTPNLMVNATMYNPALTTQSMPCCQAMSVIGQPSFGQVVNATTIQTVCNPEKRLLCCEQSSMLDPTRCGPYWGGTNEGECNSIMEQYCGTAVEGDPLCNCLRSVIPVSECADKTCRGTNAFKLSAMVANQCTGTFMTCVQVLNIAPEARGNVLTNVTLIQDCLLANGGWPIGSDGGMGSGEPETGGSITIIIIAIVIGVGVLVVGLGLFFYFRGKNNKSGKSIDTRPRKIEQPVKKPQASKVG